MDPHYTFFYSHNSDKYKSDDMRCCLSNWFPCFFSESGVETIFSSTEQYLMYHKALLFGDTSMAQAILYMSNPSDIKKAGRLVKKFDAKVWDDNKNRIMIDGLCLKFNQNPGLKNYLLSTYPNILVEASPYDNIWGIGLSENDAKNICQHKWPGQNLLGKCLMIARDMLNPTMS